MFEKHQKTMTMVLGAGTKIHAMTHLHMLHHHGRQKELKCKNLGEHLRCVSTCAWNGMIGCRPLPYLQADAFPFLFLSLRVQYKYFKKLANHFFFLPFFFLFFLFLQQLCSPEEETPYHL